MFQARRLSTPTVLAAFGALLVLLALAPQAPAAPLPGYRLEAVWPADAHGLPAPNSITTGPEQQIWLLDGPAEEAVALSADGQEVERRPVPLDSLDLAAEPGGDLYLGRWAPSPRLHSTVGRYLADGSPAWEREHDGATGTGVAAAAGRVWYSDPERGAMVWFGRADGRVSGEVIPRGVENGFPADLDVAPDGTLFATDLIGDAVLAWPPPYLPDDFARWTMLESSGPFRIGVGAQSDGELLVAVLFSDGLIRVHRPDGRLVARFFVPGEPIDLTVGLEGRIYVLDEETGQVRVYATGTPPTPTPVPPDPPISASSCQVQGTKTVDPSSLDRCGTALVTLQLSAVCPPGAVSGADVALIIDTSKSMRNGKLEGAVQAAKRFLDGLDFQYHRAGVVAFSTDARVAHPLSADRPSLDAAMDGLVTDGSATNIYAALRQASDHLRDEGRPDALPVIILLTDGDPSRPMAPEPSTAALVAAERARARRTYVVTVGLGNFIDSLLMESLASTPSDFYYAPDVVDLDKIYRTILDVVAALNLTDLVVEDGPSPGFARYVPGSGAPPPLVVGDRLQWTRPALPTGGLTYTWRAQVIGAGTGEVGQASVRYLDADGTRRTFRFGEPAVVAIVPTATPGPPQPTPTGGSTGPTPPPTLPPAPATPASCPAGSAWQLEIQGFADIVGAGGYDCPGCNGIWDAGDALAGRDLAPASAVVQGSDGKVLWVGSLVQDRPSAPPSARVLICQPPPYTVRLAQLPPGYIACPNSPLVQRVDRPALGISRRATVRFTYWSGCGVPVPTALPPATPTALPACPLP